jgi:Domain of unknown function (DUF4145)
LADNGPEITTNHCNTCGHDTRHTVVAKREHTGQEPVTDCDFTETKTTFEMLECCGCLGVTLRRTFWVEDFEHLEVESFPPRTSRRPPVWLKDAPPEIQSLLSEVYVALHADSRRLAMMGARTIIDILLVAKVGDIGGFQQKLGALEKKNLITAANRRVLEAALDTGSAVAHRGHLPGVEETNQVMDILEHLIHAGILENAARDLRSKTPPRLRIVGDEGSRPGDDAPDSSEL